ncbi:MAG: DNA replication protein [Hyphomicrobiaceae bacterium]|nr:DNA replication protein [Hyphomicrobiaceae bacterium]
MVARRNAERSRPKTAAPSPQPEQNPAESPLTWLRRHKSRDGRPLLSEAQYHAGERLRADFWRASMTPRITMSWSATPMSSSGRAGSAGRGVEFSDAALAAQERVRRALASVGPELAGVLIDVCCHLKGLEQAERSEGWPLRSAKVVLLLALTSLARHYGYIAPETAEAPIARRLRHWATSDYRPGL